MQSKHLDLVDICRLVFRKKWFVLIFAVCAAVVGLICCFMATKEYTSTTIFIVKTPQNMDRNHVFRQGMYENNDFFATENQIDNIITISHNEILLQFLVDSFHLEKHYGVATKDKAYNKIKHHFKVTRQETRSIEYAVTDKDPKLAAAMVNAARWKAGEMFRNYFIQTKNDLISALEHSITKMNAQIKNADDSIATLRQQFNIYNALLPTRGRTISNTPTGVTATKANGMELLQAVAAKKDELVKNRAQYFSLINEYRTETLKPGVNMFYTIQAGWPQTVPSFPIIPLIVAICFLAGLIFSIIIVLIQASVKRLNA